MTNLKTDGQETIGYACAGCLELGTGPRSMEWATDRLRWADMASLRGACGAGLMPGEACEDCGRVVLDG